MAKFSNLSKDAREFAENIDEWASKRGVTVSVENGATHPRFVFERGTRTRHFVFSSTPSDHRSRLNESSRIRRLFEEENWEEIVERRVEVRANDRGATFHNPSSGAASPVTRPFIPHQPKEAEPVVVQMTAPPLSHPDAIHLLGWEVPFVPECAKSSVQHGGRRSQEYVDFTVKRTHWVNTVRRAGADWPEIIQTLAKAGHNASRGALEQAIHKTRVKDTVETVLKRNTSQQKPINDLLERMNDIVRQIVERSTSNLVVEVEALTAKLEKAEQERAEYKDRYDTIKGVLKDF